MTRELRETLGEYRRALETQVRFLEAIQRLASAQHAAALRQDASALTECSAERTETMAALEALERDQQDRRAWVTAHLALVETLDEFAAVRRLHRLAGATIGEILARDAETRRSLEQSEGARRSAAHVLDAGEATLAAYRKTLAHTSPRSGIVDRHG
jgi:hypothetical protein